MEQQVWYPPIGEPIFLQAGLFIEVITLAKHSETDEPMVVFKVCNTKTVFCYPLSGLEDRDLFKEFIILESGLMPVDITEGVVMGGEYYHYKGGRYRIHALARGREGGKRLWFVVYKSLLFGSVHVRPLTMWHDHTSGGIRFTKVNERGPVLTVLRRLCVLWKGYLNL